MNKLISAISYSILGLVFALFVFSSLFFLPPTREVEIWLPAIQYLSFGLLAFCIASLVIQWVITRHPHYDIWLIGAGGIILSVYGISGNPKGILFIMGSLAIVALLFALAGLFLSLSEKGEEFISRRGWTWTRWVSKGFSLTWSIAGAVIALSLIGLCFYCLFFVPVTLSDKEYFISISFLILGMVTGGGGIWLLRYSIHKFKSIVSLNHLTS